MAPNGWGKADGECREGTHLKEKKKRKRQITGKKEKEKKIGKKRAIVLLVFKARCFEGASLRGQS